MADYIHLRFKSNQKEFIVNDDLYKLISIEGIESSDFTLNSTNNALQDGSFIYSKKVEQRYISFQVEFRGESFPQARREMITFFNPKFNGVLMIDYGGIERAIEYEVSSVSIPLPNVHYTPVVTIELICPDPYLKEVVEEKVDIATWEGGFIFPLIIPQDIGIIMGLRNPSVIVNVYNKGDVTTGMIVKFRALGELMNPSIFNVNTREFFKINRTMQAGEVITLNTNSGNKSIVSELNNVETNLFNEIDIDSTFVQLDLGDNLFRYDADLNLDNLEISIYYNPKYLGV